MKKKLFLLLIVGCIALNITAYATTGELSLNRIINSDSIMTLSGKNLSEGMAINLSVAASDDVCVFLKQATVNSKGEFSFAINLEDALPLSGGYKIQVVSQTGKSFEDNFEYCKTQDLLSVVNLINSEREKQEPDYQNLSEILASDESSVLKLIDPVVKSTFENKLHESCAKLLLLEDNITSDNIRTIMKKISAVQLLTLKNAPEDVNSLFEIYSADLLAENITDLSKCTEEEKQRFYERVALLSESYENMNDFYETMYHNVILTKFDFANGTGGMAEILDKYSSAFDFTVYNKSDNDKSAVLQIIAKVFEDDTIKSLAEVQTILDKKIVRETSGGGKGSGKGSSGSYVSGSGGSVVDFNQIVPARKTEFKDLDDFEWAKPGIEQLVSLGVLKGYSDTEFGPARPVTRAEFCTMLCRLFGVSEITGATSFTDVSKTDWFAGYVNAMYNAEVVSGVGENRFCPDDLVTRQDAAVMIYRCILKYSSIAYDQQTILPFDDSAVISEYAKQAVEGLRANNIINGKDNNNFAPKDNMLRAEAAQLMNKTYLFVESGVGK